MALIPIPIEINAVFILVPAMLACIFSILASIIFARKFPINEPKIWLIGTITLGILVGLRLAFTTPFFEIMATDDRDALILVGALLLITLETSFMLTFTLPRFELTRKWLHHFIAWQTIIAGGGFLSVLLEAREMVVAAFALPIMLLLYLVSRRYLEVKNIEQRTGKFRLTSIDDFLVYFLGATFVGVLPFLWLMPPTVFQEDLLVLFLAIISLASTTLLLRHPERWFVVDAVLRDFFIIENASETVLYSLSEKHELEETEYFLVKVLKALELGMKELIHQEQALRNLVIGENHIFLGRGSAFTTILITTKNNSIVRALSSHLHGIVENQLTTKLQSSLQEPSPQDETVGQFKRAHDELLELIARELQVIKLYFPHAG